MFKGHRAGGGTAIMKAAWVIQERIVGIMVTAERLRERICSEENWVQSQNPQDFPSFRFCSGHV